MTSGIAVETLSQFVKGDINENHTDKDIEWMSVNEAFDAWLTFNGIIGYSTTIRQVLFDIITSSNYCLETMDAGEVSKMRYAMGLTKDEDLAAK